MEGVKEVADLIAEYEKVNMQFCEPMDDNQMAALIERQGELTELMEQHDAWNLDNKLERAMDALNCPPGPWGTPSASRRRPTAPAELPFRPCSPAVAGSDRPSPPPFPPAGYCPSSVCRP